MPWSPHVFRHTAGVCLAQGATRVTESTYARYSPSFMKDAAAALVF
ncbi:MAG: hypothetical protein ABI667_07085 [Sphingomicrobium sp.]